MPSTFFLDSPGDISRILDLAAQQPLIAIDTEFISGKYYDTRLGLIQVSWDPENAYLIDPLVTFDTEKLGRILSATDIIKVLHDGEQDLALLHRLTGHRAKNVVDTQRAAGFAGLRATLSLSDLLRTVLGVKISKSAQRTNWLLRPLADRQMEYAREDVRHLPGLWTALFKEGVRRGHEAWIEEEMADYVQDHWFSDRKPKDAWLEVKGRGKLRDEELLVLMELALWRDAEARKEDILPIRILPDASLVLLARLRPGTREALNRVRVLERRDTNRFGDKILQAISRGKRGNVADLPPSPPRPVLNDAIDDVIDISLALIKHVCREGDIDFALVCSRYDVTAFLQGAIERDDPEGPLSTGWRFEFAGKVLLDLLDGRLTLGLNPHSFDTKLVRIVPYGS